MGAYFTLESSSTPFLLTFGILQGRLLQTLNCKLNNGEFTERGLARLTGISQPQVHNLLKGAHRLNPESADAFLAALHLSVLDLLTETELTPAATPATQTRNLISHKPHVNPDQQLKLNLDTEVCPRKNPIAVLPPQFGLTEQAS